MHLVLDIGNTIIKWALFQSDNIIDNDVLSKLSIEHLKSIHKKYPKIERLCFSNTRNKTKLIEQFCEESKIKCLKADYNCNLPIFLDYNTPNTLGSDRIALCVGDHYNYSGNKLIIDLGTCITYDLIINKKYMGGQISPGVYMRLRSLHNDTANLPNLEFKIIKKSVGKTTEESILIGIYDGILNEIQGIIQKYKLRYPNIKVILTGGDMDFFKKRIKNINFINPYLLMEGLNYIIASNE